MKAEDIQARDELVSDRGRVFWTVVEAASELRDGQRHFRVRFPDGGFGHRWLPADGRELPIRRAGEIV